MSLWRSFYIFNWKAIDIYTLLKDYDIVNNASLEENFRHSDVDVINNGIEDEHEPSCPLNDSGQTVRNRSCCPLQVKEWKDIQNGSIEHMWNIILEKFNFEIPSGRKEAIYDHMNALYRDYRHKMKKQYFDSKTTYHNSLKNKPKHVTMNDWKYLVNLWSDTTFQERSMKNKKNREKRSMPPYTGTKSYARLRHQMKKEKGKVPSRVEVWIESRKRKRDKEIDPSSQNIIVQFDHLKKQQEEGQISLDDEEIFQEVLGPEKNGYVRAYGPGKSIKDYFGVIPSKVELIKQVEATKKEASEQVEMAKREANARVEAMEKQMDEKIAKMNRDWEEKIKMLFHFHAPQMQE
ncbi:uncharacterized protein LOC120284038 [Dioscorea cayenensis subsp. rotundata]|uniref:Uncharacterized protein LOC120284038 n=1 Tax=Dioscorea cayennensis subsp. rotundata TaxID=55577 RepID=A0AB40D2Z8_DIOCR|nr:uncharacterized protein LOC120284038 [Dioscorea cayenensis subsp. rotundata]